MTDIEIEKEARYLLNLFPCRVDKTCTGVPETCSGCKQDLEHILTFAKKIRTSVVKECARVADTFLSTVPDGIDSHLDCFRQAYEMSGKAIRALERNK